jgi:hypothetical protein
VKAALFLAVACTACGLVNGLDGRGAPSQPANPLNWAWHGPTRVDQDLPKQSDNPRLAFGQGKTWLVWQSFDSDAKSGSVWVTNRAHGQAFATPQQLPVMPGWPGGAFFPHLAIGETGDPVVAMEGNSNASGPATYSIWAVRLHGGLTAPASDLVRVDSPDSNTPQLSQGRSLAVDAGGNALLMWGQAGGVYASASAGGKTWTPAALVDGTTPFNTFASVEVASGSPGFAISGWSTGDTVSARPVGIGSGAMSPGSPKTLGSGSNLPGPAISARKDKAMTAWKTDSSIVAQTFNGGAWGIPATVTSTGAGYYFQGAVAVDSQGRAVLLWQDVSAGGGTYNGAVAASFFDGSNWSAPQIISVPGSTRKAWWMAVEMNDVGTAVAAWADFDAGGTFTRIWANVLHFETGTPAWKGAEPIDQASPTVYLADTPENVRDIRIAMDPAGSSATVVWIQHGEGADPTPRTWANWLE